MKNTVRLMVFGASLLCLPQSHAMPKCPPSSRIPSSNYPGAEAVLSTNNLLRPTGKSLDVEGQKLIIEGQVLDSNCMPVTQAIVEIWQVDPFGKYTLASDEDVVTPTAYFAGAGRAVTDNEGRFHFISAFPGILSYQAWETYQVTEKGKLVTKKRQVALKRAPHVNLLVKANGFSTFSTALYFENDGRNTSDPVLQKHSPKERASVMMSVSTPNSDEIVAEKQIVLDGVTPYRTY